MRGQKEKGKTLRCLPPVGAEKQVDDMIVHIDLALQVRVDHLANWRCAVCRPC